MICAFAVRYFLHWTFRLCIFCTLLWFPHFPTYLIAAHGGVGDDETESRFIAVSLEVGDCHTKGLCHNEYLRSSLFEGYEIIVMLLTQEEIAGHTAPGRQFHGGPEIPGNHQYAVT